MNILVVDDHPLVRRGIMDILSIDNTWEKILEASNTEDTMNIIKKVQIDLLLVDLNLGRDNGFDLIEAAREVSIKSKCVILTSSLLYSDIRKAQQLRVDGYILKDAFVDDILYALGAIMRGEKYYSPQLLRNSMNCFHPKELYSLTDREKEILSYLSKGLTNAQISEQLFITEGTTKKHISNILSKLNFTSRVEAILFSRQLYGN